MPLLMRSRGGLGTHWKMPSRVPFQVPAKDENKPDVKLELSGEDTICLIQALFANDIQNRSAPTIKSTLGNHVQCSTKNLPKEVSSAFLDDQEALQIAWRRMKKTLQ